jgi:hypothetical protein
MWVPYLLANTNTYEKHAQKRQGSAGSANGKNMLINIHRCPYISRIKTSYRYHHAQDDKAELIRVLNKFSFPF